MNLSNKDYIELGIFLSTVFVFVYDRLSLVKRHDKALAQHDAALGALSESMQELRVTLAGLLSEFRTYREMNQNNIQFRHTHGSQEYAEGYRNQ